MEELSYDIITQEIIDEKLNADGSLWRQAGLIYLAKDRMKATSKMLSADTGYSPSSIDLYAKTFAIFPSEGDRILDLSFSIHSTCASTDSPSHWLRLASENNWSVRDLKKAIKGEVVADPLDEAVKVWNSVLKVMEKGGDGQQYLQDRIAEYTP